MSIKNRDGSTFKLRGPNPLLKSQNIPSEIEMLNIHNIESLSDVEEVVYVKHPEAVTKQPELKPTAPPEPIQHKAPNDISKESKPVAYCLPAIEDRKYDLLTDEFTSSIRYGERFTFEVAMLEEDYISCLMWGPLEDMPINSIIYIYDQRRWWKVLSTKPHEGGLLISCMPSEKNPSFAG